MKRWFWLWYFAAVFGGGLVVGELISAAGRTAEGREPYPSTQQQREWERAGLDPGAMWSGR